MSLIGVRKAPLLYAPSIITSSTFHPSDLYASRSGGWWDFGDTDTLFEEYDSKTTTPGVGDPIGTAEDISGEGNDITSDANSTVRPTLISGGGAQFTRANSTTLNLTFGSRYTGTDIHAFVVCVPNATEPNSARYMSFRGSTDDWASADAAVLIMRKTNNGTDVESYRNVGSRGNQTITPGSLNLIECVYDGANNFITVNGVSGSNSAFTAAFDADNLGIGSVPQGSGEHVDSQIMEAGLVFGEVTGDDLTNTRNYLNNKWSIY